MGNDEGTMFEPVAGEAGREVSGEDEPLPTPEESPELIEATRARAAEELGVREDPEWVAWGLAWLVAFGTSFLAVAGAGPQLPIPGSVLALLWSAAMLAALVFTLAYGRRQRRGRTGRSKERALIAVLGGGAMVVFGALRRAGEVQVEP